MRALLLLATLAISTPAFAQNGRLTICFSDGQSVQVVPAGTMDGVATYELANGWLRAPVGRIRDCGITPRTPTADEGYRLIHLGASGSIAARAENGNPGIRLILLDGGDIVVEGRAITAAGPIIQPRTEPEPRPQPEPQVTAQEPSAAVADLRAQWESQATEVPDGGNGALVGMAVGAGMFGGGVLLIQTGDKSYQGFDGQVLVGGAVAATGVVVFTGSVLGAIVSGITR